jgi:hypothetical protein
MVLSKDKRLLPVRLTVRKISGLSEDSLYMGVMEVSGSLNESVGGIVRCWSPRQMR